MRELNIPTRQNLNTKFRTFVGVILVVMVLLGYACLIFLIVTFSRNKSSPIIRASSREMCYLIFTGEFDD